jgi:hypothetical protein
MRLSARARASVAAAPPGALARLRLLLLHDFPDPGRFHRFPCSSLGHVKSPMSGRSRACSVVTHAQPRPRQVFYFLLLARQASFPLALM